MTLARDLRNLAGRAPSEVPSVTRIEDRAGRLSRRKRASNTAVLIVVIAVGALAAPQISSLLDQTTTPPAPEPPSEQLYFPTPAPIETSCPLTFDSCGWEDEALPMPLAQEWLGSILNRAGVEYTNEYRPDGGGGHVAQGWGFIIYVLRPVEEIERAALRFEHEPIWSEGDRTVYGAQYDGETSSGAYFMWQVGGVVTVVSKKWNGEPPRPEDLRPVIARIIREQERSPFPYGSD